MARIDVLREEIAEARERRQTANIGTWSCALILFLAIWLSSIIIKEPEIWAILAIIILALFGLGASGFYSWRVKKLTKELEAISRRPKRRRGASARDRGTMTAA